MKNLIILLFCSIAAFGLQAQTMDTVGFCPSGAKWLVSTFSPGFTSTYVLFQYEKDTTLLQKTVKQINLSDVYLTRIGGLTNRTITPRTDKEYWYKSNDTVYRYQSQGDTFFVWWVNNRNVGDSMTIGDDYAYCSTTQSPIKACNVIIDSVAYDTVRNVLFKKTLQAYDTSKTFYASFVYENIGPMFFFNKINRSHCIAFGSKFDVIQFNLEFYEDSLRGRIYPKTNNVPPFWTDSAMSYIMFSPLLSVKNEYKLIIYPNPTTDAFQLGWNTSYELANVAVIDLQGRIVKTWLKPLSNFNFNVADLPAGMYIVKVADNKQQTWTAKWIKQ